MPTVAQGKFNVLFKQPDNNNIKAYIVAGKQQCCSIQKLYSTAISNPLEKNGIIRKCFNKKAKKNI